VLSSAGFSRGAEDDQLELLYAVDEDLELFRPLLASHQG